MSFFQTYNRFQKFIRNTFCIRFFNQGKNIVGFFSYSIYHNIIGQFHSFPSFIAVHRIISAGNCCQFSGGKLHMLKQICYKIFPRMRITIATIGESMYVNLIIKPIFVSCGKQSFQVIDM